MEKMNMEIGWRNQSVRFIFFRPFVKELSFFFPGYP
jgi:hypothetical protein